MDMVSVIARIYLTDIDAGNKKGSSCSSRWWNTSAARLIGRPICVRKLERLAT
jgi:hypothetical protein